MDAGHPLETEYVHVRIKIKLTSILCMLLLVQDL